MSRQSSLGNPHLTQTPLGGRLSCALAPTALWSELLPLIPLPDQGEVIARAREGVSD
jgi:hypothetical protein